MKKVIIIVLCVLIAAVVAVVATLGGVGYYAYAALDTVVEAPAVAEDGSLVVMSANIRRQEKLINFKKEDMGNHRWYKRAKYYLKNIETVKPDILGVQEAQERQFNFLKEHLKGYAGVFTARDKMGTRSEACPIFYSTNRFELVESGTYWLSETPEKMSKDWGSDEYRITTYVILKDKTNDMTIAVFNAHPDWPVPEARVKQLAVLAEKAKEADADKVIVLGDMNSARNLPYGNAGLAPLDELLQDSKTFPGMADYGDTFNGYGIDPDGPMALDYIFLPKDAKVYAVGKVDTVYDGVYPSDHFPIWAKVKFE